MADNRLDKLPLTGDRFKLGSKIVSGVCGILYEADDSKTGNKVAIRAVTLNKDRLDDIFQESNVLKTLPQFENIPAYVGTFKKQGRADIQQAWVVTDFCDGGTLGDYVRGIHKLHKRLPEDHIAYILRELIKAVVHCHDNNVIHRNVKTDSVFLTADGEVKLGNFGISTQVKDAESKLNLCIGTPCFLAPEVATSEHKENDGYDVRADVWTIGITAIELGDGNPPLAGIHPARALFQITRNPPPTLFRPANWSQLYNDFITECLEKSPENRPHSQELLEHPFFEGIQDKISEIQRDISLNIIEIRAHGFDLTAPHPDVLIRGKHWEQEQKSPQKLLQEDIAALKDISEDIVVEELNQRIKNEEFYTFVGDVLIALNPNKKLDIFGEKFHSKYQFKARSDNSPHIYTVADKAYQDVLHNEEPQHILLAGETMSGKSTNAGHVIDHLLFLGKGNACIEDVRKAFNIINALGNAGTTQNANSTRHILQTQITFTSTGKVSGAIFWLYLLEKSRVTIPDGKHANFHIFYYFYDGLEADGTLPQWNLEEGRDYNYLRVRASGATASKISARESPRDNTKKWKQFQNDLEQLGITDSNLHAFKSVLAAILLLGEVKFSQGDDGFAQIINPEIVENVASLLKLDQKKFSWALLNYCVVEKGEATRRHHKLAEAVEARDVLAQGLYSRLVDWTICKINEKLSICRAIFGDRRFISVTDLFGFECYTKNTLQQLLVNCVNEQLQFYYNQRVFVWEVQEGEEDEIPVPNLTYYDNKMTVDQLLGKPDGLMYVMDEASRGGGLVRVNERMTSINASHITMTGSEFSVAHYAGRVTYDATDFPDKNRDFLPPEMIETLRRSSDSVIQTLFTGLFSKSGNLTVPVDPEVLKKAKGRWEAVITAENEKLRARKYNTESRGQYSQSRQMRTASSAFRGTCLELLRSLAGSCGVHFVRCIRTSLTDQPDAMPIDLLKQQVRALGILDTARARQRGYSSRIPFQEFIRRYKFLAFDFDEPVEVTKDNCRLLLIRLKMEGWVIGKTKVFLKYYNEEFLSRLYETQVKKIIKVQSMMRAFLAKRTIANKLENIRKSGSKDGETLQPGEAKNAKKELSQEEAAIIIQKQIRGTLVRKQYGPMVKSATGHLDEETVIFMRKWCKRWQLKSIFQVLLLYRATRHQDLIYFCQQSHLYNQNALSELQDLNRVIELDDVDPKAKPETFLPPPKPAVYKLPFRLSDLPYFDSTYMCDPARSLRYKKNINNDESWDAPLRRNVGEKYSRVGSHQLKEQGCQTIAEKGGLTKKDGTDNNLPETPFIREQTKGVRLQSKFDDHRVGYKAKGPSDLGKAQVYKGTKVMASKDHGRENKSKGYNPIKEMEDKFRQSSTEGDDPPFNFQAMLRKTNNKRESLKRADDGQTTSVDNVIFNSTNNNRNESNNNFGRRSPCFTQNVSSSFENAENNNVGRRSSNIPANTSSAKKSVDNILELAPGLIVHGEVADL